MKKKYEPAYIGAKPFWHIRNMNAVSLSRKGLIPPYIAHLWEKSHNGITPLWWKILNKIVDFLWTMLAITVILGGVIVMGHYHVINDKNKFADVISIAWIAFTAIAFMVGYAYFDVFDKLERNWKRFNSHFQELARVFYFEGKFPETCESFVDEINKVLVRRAYHLLKEKAKEDWQSNYRMGDLYNAAKAFGILDYGDVGYKPYFVEAQRMLDEEEIPLFVQH